MTVLEKSVEELTLAYRILDAQTSASALAIKSNYRKLIKRWHPDKPATGAATQEEAVMMTKLINEAYALIENAPLRYYAGPARDAIKNPKEGKIHGVSDVDLPKAFFNEKRIEYAVRIVCGAISGAFVGFAFSLDAMRDRTEVMVAVAICAAGFAIGTMKHGDRFWRGVFGIWWRWQ